MQHDVKVKDRVPSVLSLLSKFFRINTSGRNDPQTVLHSSETKPNRTPVSSTSPRSSSDGPIAAVPPPPPPSSSPPHHPATQTSSPDWASSHHGCGEETNETDVQKEGCAAHTPVMPPESRQETKEAEEESRIECPTRHDPMENIVSDAPSWSTEDGRIEKEHQDEAVGQTTRDETAMHMNCAEANGKEGERVGTEEKKEAEGGREGSRPFSRGDASPLEDRLSWGMPLPTCSPTPYEWDLELSGRRMDVPPIGKSIREEGFRKGVGDSLSEGGVARGSQRKGGEGSPREEWANDGPTTWHSPTLSAVSFHRRTNSCSHPILDGYDTPSSMVAWEESVSPRFSITEGDEGGGGRFSSSGGSHMGYSLERHASYPTPSSSSSCPSTTSPAASVGGPFFPSGMRVPRRKKWLPSSDPLRPPLPLSASQKRSNVPSSVPSLPAMVGEEEAEGEGEASLPRSDGSESGVLGRRDASPPTIPSAEADSSSTAPVNPIVPSTLLPAESSCPLSSFQALPRSSSPSVGVPGAGNASSTTTTKTTTTTTTTTTTSTFTSSSVPTSASTFSTSSSSFSTSSSSVPSLTMHFESTQRGGSPTRFSSHASTNPSSPMFLLGNAMENPDHHSPLHPMPGKEKEGEEEWWRGWSRRTLSTKHPEGTAERAMGEEKEEEEDHHGEGGEGGGGAMPWTSSPSHSLQEVGNAWRTHPSSRDAERRPTRMGSGEEPHSTRTTMTDTHHHHHRGQRKVLKTVVYVLGGQHGEDNRKYEDGVAQRVERKKKRHHHNERPHPEVHAEEEKKEEKEEGKSPPQEGGPPSSNAEARTTPIAPTTEEAGGIPSERTDAPKPRGEPHHSEAHAKNTTTDAKERTIRHAPHEADTCANAEEEVEEEEEGNEGSSSSLSGGEELITIVPQSSSVFHSNPLGFSDSIVSGFSSEGEEEKAATSATLGRTPSHSGERTLSSSSSSGRRGSGEGSRAHGLPATTTTTTTMQRHTVHRSPGWHAVWTKASPPSLKDIPHERSEPESAVVMPWDGPTSPSPPLSSSLPEDGVREAIVPPPPSSGWTPRHRMRPAQEGRAIHVPGEHDGSPIPTVTKESSAENPVFLIPVLPSPLLLPRPPPLGASAGSTSVSLGSTSETMGGTFTGESRERSLSVGPTSDRSSVRKRVGFHQTVDVWSVQEGEYASDEDEDEEEVAISAASPHLSATPTATTTTMTGPPPLSSWAWRGAGEARCSATAWVPSSRCSEEEEMTSTTPPPPFSLLHPLEKVPVSHPRLRRQTSPEVGTTTTTTTSASLCGVSAEERRTSDPSSCSTPTSITLQHSPHPNRLRRLPPSPLLHPLQRREWQWGYRPSSDPHLSDAPVPEEDEDEEEEEEEDGREAPPHRRGWRASDLSPSISSPHRFPRKTTTTTTALSSSPGCHDGHPSSDCERSPTPIATTRKTDVPRTPPLQLFLYGVQQHPLPTSILRSSKTSGIFFFPSSSSSTPAVGETPEEARSTSSFPHGEEAASWTRRAASLAQDDDNHENETKKGMPSGDPQWKEGDDPDGTGALPKQESRSASESSHSEGSFSSEGTFVDLEDDL